MKATAPIARVLDALPDGHQTGETQYSARCPAHDDGNASLSIGVKPDGTVGLHCHAGCETSAICDALGLTLADLFPAKTSAKHSTAAKKRTTAKALKVAPVPEGATREAMAAAKRLGSFTGYKLTALYPYRLATGEVWGWRARYDNGDGKQIKPLHFDGAEWVAKEPTPPRKGKPLYRLPETMAGADPVFIVEGEKCADALAALGLTATTSGAAKSAGKTDWTPLAGRRCIVWPDNDEPGDTYAADVAEALLAQGCDVATIDPARIGLHGQGDDAADWLAARSSATAADVLAIPTNPVTPPSAVKLVCAADVAPKPVDWLWPGWLPLSMLAILAGNGGTGKTTLALTIAAAVTTGARFPDGSTAPRGDVLIWTGEDAIAEVLVPRLQEAGADLRRIHFVQAASDGEPFDPAHDVPALEGELRRLGRVALVIVDPIVSAIAGDSHKNAEVRRGLQPLMSLAANSGAAVLGITHYAKNTAGRSTTDRVIGSVAFSAMARVVLATAMGPEGEGRMVRSKNNLGPTGDGFAYSIEVVQRDFGGRAAQVSKILWGSALFGRADGLLGELEGKRNPREEAADWLAATLHDGPMPYKVLMAKASEDGISEKTLRRAKEALSVVAERKGSPGKGRGAGEWAWRLPTSGREAAEVMRKAKAQ